jgi:hypothetical protein
MGDWAARTGALSSTPSPGASGEASAAIATEAAKSIRRGLEILLLIEVVEF